jgi:hypothetical protein
VRALLQEDENDETLTGASGAVRSVDSYERADTDEVFHSCGDCGEVSGENHLEEHEEKLVEEYDDDDDDDDDDHDALQCE